MIDCPKCKTKQEFNFISFVSASDSKELKVQLLKHELNKFICQNCGCAEVVDNSLMYLDGDKKFMLYSLYGQDAGESLESLKRTASFPPDFKIRLVENAEEMIDKVRIFDVGLKDTAVEYFKAMIVMQAVKSGKPQPDGIYFRGIEKSRRVDTLAFDVYSGSGVTPFYTPLEQAMKTMDEYPDDFGELSELGKLVVNLETLCLWLQKKGKG